jgi:hypothetical protein
MQLDESGKPHLTFPVQFAHICVQNALLGCDTHSVTAPETALTLRDFPSRQRALTWTY